MSGGRRLAIFSLICLFSFSYLDSIDGDTYEFTTPRSPKIEVVSPPFFRCLGQLWSKWCDDWSSRKRALYMGCWALLFLGPPAVASPAWPLSRACGDDSSEHNQRKPRERITGHLILRCMLGLVARREGARLLRPPHLPGTVVRSRGIGGLNLLSWLTPNDWSHYNNCSFLPQLYWLSTALMDIEFR